MGGTSTCITYCNCVAMSSFINWHGIICQYIIYCNTVHLPRYVRHVEHFATAEASTGSSVQTQYVRMASILPACSGRVGM